MFHAAILWSVSAVWADPQPLPRDPAGDPTEPAPASAPAQTTEEDDGPADGGPPTDLPNTFSAELQAAKTRYFAGEIEEARRLLVRLRRRLELGEEASAEDAREAMTYLGEVLFKLDDEAGAADAFRFILERDPDTPISPYHHPIGVVNLFGMVRQEVIASQRRPVEPEPVEPPEVGRPPLWTYAPLGIPQFAQGRPGAGLAFGGLQAAFGVASVALWADLRTRLSRDPDVSKDDPDYDTVWDETERVQLVQKYGLQWPAAIAFYGVWAVSAVDAGRTWRKRKVEARLGVAPVSPHTQGVIVHARF